MICPNCSSIETLIVYENKGMPYGLKLKEKTIDIELRYCKDCKFVFQSSSYTNAYDKNILELYRSYNISDMYNFPNRNRLNERAVNFISEYIRDEINFNILEIGSNRGDFLYLLKEKYQKINILGCEPTHFKELIIPTINSFFNKELFNTKFDLVILRHTLEHIKNPKNFILEINSILKNDGKLFIEVPNINYSLKNFIEDFTPDHVNFFSLETLIKTVDKTILKYDDTEYLYAIFSNYKNSSDYIIEENYSQLFYEYIKRSEEIIEELKKYNRVVFYGISNYYLWTYIKLKDFLNDKELFFKDDYLENDCLNNLPKIENFQENDLVILCSSNKLIQKKMASTLPKNVDILYPWEKIENV